MEEGKADKEKMNKYAFACSVVASMISIIFGYDTGVMSGAMIFIKEDLKVSDTQIEVLAGILNFCALFGALAAGRTSDIIGRRYTIVVASVIFFLGSALMGYGPNYAVLMIGRCTAGIGVGFALMIAPVYSAEISSASSRGFLSSLPELCISIGVLLGYLANYFLSKLPLKYGWRVMLALAAIPSIGLTFGMLPMPESPRWLIMQGKLGEARKILSRISNSKEEAENRFRDIAVAANIDQNCCTENTVKVSGPTHGEGVWKELLIRPTPAVRWMVVAAIGIHFFEHATGIEAVILYGPRIFKKAGVKTKNKLLLATVGIGITKFLCILTANLFIDRVGRRRLVLLSVGAMIPALLCLGSSLTVVEHTDGELVWALGLSIAATYLYVAFFNLGLAPVTWVYTSEIFPLRLRAQGHSIGVAVNRVMNATISMSFISIYKAITIGGTFYMFGGISILAWVFFYFFLPETKGKTLEEMEEMFSRLSNNKGKGGGGGGGSRRGGGGGGGDNNIEMKKSQKTELQS